MPRLPEKRLSVEPLFIWILALLRYYNGILALLRYYNGFQRRLAQAQKHPTSAHGRILTLPP